MQDPKQRQHLEPWTRLEDAVQGIQICLGEAAHSRQQHLGIVSWEGLCVQGIKHWTFVLLSELSHSDLSTKNHPDFLSGCETGINTSSMTTVWSPICM